MSAAAAMQAVTAIFAASSALTTAFGSGGLYWMKASRAQSGPFLVGVVTDDVEDDTAGNAAARCVVSLSIYTSKSLGPEAQTALQSAIKTAYHKVKPAAISGYDFSMFARVGGFQVDEPDEFLHFVEQYAVYVFTA